MKNYEEIKTLILENQIGIRKKYALGDLLRFTVDVKEAIDTGMDVFMEYVNVLPSILSEKQKIKIETWNNHEAKVREMKASCTILSAGEVKEILDFIEYQNSLIPPELLPVTEPELNKEQQKIINIMQSKN